MLSNKTVMQHELQVKPKSDEQLQCMWHIAVIERPYRIQKYVKYKISLGLHLFVGEITAK